MEYLLAAFLGWLNLTADLPSVEDLDRYFAPGITTVVDQQGERRLSLFRENREFASIDEVPKLVIDAVTSAEDKRFWEHDGVDSVAFARAMLQNVVRAGSGERLLGASTITQQLAKRRYTDASRTVRRKAREALIALRIEEKFDKQRIMEIYLNDLYFGRGAYGIKRASKVYFSKPMAELTIEEAAFLASLPKAPSTYANPDKKDRAKERRDWIIDQMVENGYVNRLQGLRAKLKPLTYNDAVKDELLQERVARNYFDDQVKRELVELFGADLVFEGKLKVVTTIDAHLQERAEIIFRRFLEKYDRKNGWRGPVDHVNLKTDRWRVRLATQPDIKAQHEVAHAIVLETSSKFATIQLADTRRGRIPSSSLGWTRSGSTSADRVFKPGDIITVMPLDPEEKNHSERLYILYQEPKLNGAMVVMQPTTGHIKALVGGYDYVTSNFNRASQAWRQPGSSFKPVVYLTALNNGFSPSSTLQDRPVSFPSGNGNRWSPKNYDGGYEGSTTLARALYRSRNVPAVNTAYQLGVKRVRAYADFLGIGEKQPRNLSIALGAGLVTMVDMVGAYAMIANGGLPVYPTTIDIVENHEGQRILDTKRLTCQNCLEESPLERRKRIWRNSPQVIITRTSVDQLRSIMQDVVQRGTAQRIRSQLTVPVAGKTGTTNDNKDAWFIGFWGDLLIGVYVGYDTPKRIGNGATGGALAAPIFAATFNEALASRGDWLDSRQVTDDMVAEIRSDFSRTGRINNAAGATLYARASSQSEQLLFLPVSERVIVGRCASRYCQVLFRGQRGYVKENRLVISSQPPTKAQIEEALSELMLAYQGTDQAEQGTRSGATPLTPLRPLPDAQQFGTGGGLFGLFRQVPQNTTQTKKKKRGTVFKRRTDTSDR